MLCSAVFCSAHLVSAVLVCSAHWLLSVPVSSARASLLHPHLWCFRPASETQPSSHWWKGKVHSRSNHRAGLHRQKSPPLAPDWSVLTQIRTLNPCSLMGAKGTVQIGQNRGALVGRRCEALVGWGQSPHHGCSRTPGTPLSEVAGGRNTVQAGRPAGQCRLLPSAVCMTGP